MDKCELQSDGQPCYDLYQRRHKLANLDRAGGREMVSYD
jgi:hypothetical protein